MKEEEKKELQKKEMKQLKKQGCVSKLPPKQI